MEFLLYSKSILFDFNKVKLDPGHEQEGKKTQSFFLATTLTWQSDHSRSGGFQHLKAGRAFCPPTSLLLQLQSLGLCSGLLHGVQGLPKCSKGGLTWAKGSALLGRVWVWIQTNSSGFSLVQCNREQTLHTVRKNSPFTALISQDLGDAPVSSEASSKGTKLQKKQVLDCLCCEALDRKSVV